MLNIKFNDLLSHRNFRFGRTVFRHVGRLDTLIERNGIPGLLSVMQAAIVSFDLDRKGFEAIGHKVCPPDWQVIWSKLIDQFTSPTSDGLWEVDHKGCYRLSAANTASIAGTAFTNERPWMDWRFDPK
jgi:hypothetical protein